jgi:hypothetical protein
MFWRVTTPATSRNPMPILAALKAVSDQAAKLQTDHTAKQCRIIVGTTPITVPL